VSGDEVPLPEEDAAGDGQEGIVPPGDRPWASEDPDITAEGQREGLSLDRRLAMDEPDRQRRLGDEEAIELIDEDRPDDEPRLVGDAVDPISDASAEERAMRVRSDAPGATDDDDDGYVSADGGIAP
jgi:hypothetical protein